ncbi:nucleotidyl transferase AbiEii/AbiGii toxin family protein [Candidatus Leptofilum sp.]|uniref:nucleotidyl transferase AbiEii/AbiGii toxin family protein n=1 Tax=Candidatus Leptofilum sp. TaxID=3241576 RepID=UPI003B58E7AF
MTVINELEPLLSPIAAIQKLIEHFDDQGIVIGGVAASILGKPRLTADADAMLLLSIEDVPQLVELAEKVGLTPRLPDVVEFAQRSRVVLLEHQATGINVDISLGLLPFEIEAVERSQNHQIGTISVRLPTPEDLIILKAVANRPKDLLDIAAVISSNPNLDQNRIALWVRQFAELLEAPELWLEVEKLLQDVSQ